MIYSLFEKKTLTGLNNNLANTAVVFCLSKDEDKEAVRLRVSPTFMLTVEGTSLWLLVLCFADPGQASQEDR